MTLIAHASVISAAHLCLLYKDLEYSRSRVANVLEAVGTIGSAGSQVILHVVVRMNAAGRAGLDFDA